MTASAGLPFVDEHMRELEATPEQTWAALQDYVAAMTSAPHAVLGPLLGTHPRSGFEVVGSDPPHEVVLGGRHRFSTYRLVFRVEPDGPGVTPVRADLRRVPRAAREGLSRGADAEHRPCPGDPGHAAHGRAPSRGLSVRSRQRQGVERTRRRARLVTNGWLCRYSQGRPIHR